MDLTTIRTNAGVPFTVGKTYAPNFLGLLNGLEGAGYAINAGQSGGYNPRNIAGTNTPSQHSFGRAIDVNWDANARGTQGNIPADLARSLASQNGLKWGGDWKNPDPMHFEIAAAAAPPQSAALPSSSPSPSMSLGGPMPAPQQQPENGNPFLDTLSQRMQSPLFLGGMGMLVAANQGRDAAAGMMSGLQTGAGLVKSNREMARQKIMDDLWNDPQFWKSSAVSSLPPELVEVAKRLPPDQGGQVLGNFVSRRKDVEQMGDIARQNADIEVEKANRLAVQQQQRMMDALNQFRRQREPAPQAAPPRMGEVVDGYRFKGGNPADPQSWEKQ